MFIILGADGKEYGPVSARQIHEWIHEGRANLETKAKRQAETTWKTLGEFHEFGAPVSPASSPVIAPEPPPIPTAVPFVPVTPVEAALPSASLALRLTAAVVDGTLKTLCFLPTTLPMYRYIQQRALENPPPSFQETIEATNGMLEANISKSFPYLIALILVQLVLITVRGQSIGKLLVGIRIVRADNDRHAGFLRGYLLRSFLPQLFQQIPVIGVPLFWIVDTCCIFREDRRCLHDLAAGTRVIAGSKPRD